MAHVNDDTWKAFGDSIAALECKSFPASIRDSASALRRVAYSTSSVFIVCYHHLRSQVVGYVCGDQLSNFSDVPGVAHDLEHHTAHSFYLSSIAVDSPWRNLGIGTTLQRTCIEQARAKGYRRVTAHLRHGVGTKIMSQARVLGSYDNWYNTGERYDYVLLWKLAGGRSNATT
jgi:GNAT superfamily N-acetyltransferase